MRNFLLITFFSFVFVWSDFQPMADAAYYLDFSDFSAEAGFEDGGGIAAGGDLGFASGEDGTVFVWWDSGIAAGEDLGISAGEDLGWSVLADSGIAAGEDLGIAADEAVLPPVPIAQAAAVPMVAEAPAVVEVPVVAQIVSPEIAIVPPAVAVERPPVLLEELPPTGVAGVARPLAALAGTSAGLIFLAERFLLQRIRLRRKMRLKFRLNMLDEAEMFGLLFDTLMLAALSSSHGGNYRKTLQNW